MQELDDKVSVELRAARASGRHNGNGGPQRIFDAPELKWWQRFFRWENLTMAGREVRGFVVPQWMAVVLLGAFITGMGFMYR